MAVIDGFISHRLSHVNTVQRKLLDEPEGDFSSDLSYSDDRTTGPVYLIRERR